MFYLRMGLMGWYIEHVCIYLYIPKIVTNIITGFKIVCQVRGGGQKFKNHNR